MSDLEDFLLDEVRPAVDPSELDDDERVGWRIDSDELAGWALRKLARARQELDRVNGAADAEIDRVERWRLEALGGPQRDADFFSGALAEWHRRRLAAEYGDDLEAVWDRVRSKTVKLPAGSVSARRSSPTVVVDDETILVQWAVENDHLELLRVKPAVSELKKLHNPDGRVVTDDGEVVPCARWTDPHISFTAKPDTTAEQPAWLPAPDGEA